MICTTSRTVMMRTVLVGALALAVFVAARPARADVYVLESTTTSINPGSHLAASDAISIPAGSFIRAVLSSGKTQTIKGPFSGSVADLDKGRVHNDGVLSWIRSILETGGSREVTPGATRSIRREPVLSLAFSWSSVPVTSDTTVCLPKTGTAELVRAPSQRADRVIIVDTANGTRGEAQWQAGSDVAAWPANLALRNTDYALMMPDRPQRHLSVRVLETLPADDDVLVVLHGLGCKPQFDAWVRARLAGAKRSER